MAKISEFTLNPEKVTEGEWIEVGPSDNSFYIKSKGLGDAYRDGLFRLQRDAARRLNRGLKPGDTPYNPATLPPSIDDLSQAQALVEHCFMDVKGLVRDDETPVTAEEFKQLLLNGENRTLVMLSLAAASQVGAAQAEELEDSVKN